MRWFCRCFVMTRPSWLRRLGVTVPIVNGNNKVYNDFRENDMRAGNNHGRYSRRRGICRPLSRLRGHSWFLRRFERVPDTNESLLSGDRMVLGQRGRPVEPIRERSKTSASEERSGTARAVQGVAH